MYAKNMYKCRKAINKWLWRKKMRIEMFLTSSDVVRHVRPTKGGPRPAAAHLSSGSLLRRVVSPVKSINFYTNVIQSNTPKMKMKKLVLRQISLVHQQFSSPAIKSCSSVCQLVSNSYAKGTLKWLTAVIYRHFLTSSRLLTHARTCTCPRAIWLSSPDFNDHTFFPIV